MRGLTWKHRHLFVILLALAGVYALLLSRAEWSEMHRWNRAIGDMSLVLVAFAMAIGPLARLRAATRVLLPWRRELGVYSVVLAAIHTVIILAGWIEWDLIMLFGFQFHPGIGSYVMVQQGFALANVLGIAALLIGLGLAITSNDFSLRFLGGKVWKFVQQGTYALWWLIVLHTGYFLFVHFLDFHRQTPEPNWAQLPFIVLVVVVFGLQVAATSVTWARARDRLAETS